MSSLSATQADGYYLPPEYYDSNQYKKKTKNQFAGSKGHNQFLQKGLVRFELPYKGICQGCEKSIGRGTRYNAQKTKTGDSYFSTPIWEFSMKCRNCQHPWNIRTNPQQRGFDYEEGITIQAGQESTDLVDVAAVATETQYTADNNSKSSLDRLESIASGQRKTLTEIEELQQIQTQKQATTLNDSPVNATIRSRFRTDQKEKKNRIQQAAKIGWGKGMELLGSTVNDAVASKEMVFGQPRQQERRRFASVRKSFIFSPASKKTKRSRKSPSLPVVEKSSPMPDPFVSESSCGRRDAPSPPSTVYSSTISSEQVAAGPTTRKKRKIHLQSADIIQQAASSSLGDMLAGYGSDSSVE